MTPDALREARDRAQKAYVEAKRHGTPAQTNHARSAYLLAQSELRTALLTLAKRP